MRLRVKRFYQWCFWASCFHNT